MRCAVVIGIAAAALLWCADSRRSDVWKFDSITLIGGHAVTAEGHPRGIAPAAGKDVGGGGGGGVGGGGGGVVRVCCGGGPPGGRGAPPGGGGARPGGGGGGGGPAF